MSANRLSATEAEKNAAKFPPVKSVVEHILSHAQDSRPVIQDFVPLADNIEMALGHQYLMQEGTKSFIAGEAGQIPYIVNNDSLHARHCVEVFFASLVEADKAGNLEPEIFVLELGIGVGLFARFFLDYFRDLCRQHQRDYYDRLTYIAADKSERMLLDLCRHGVLAHHTGHYCVRVVDAMCPEKDLLRDIAFRNHPRRQTPLRAVFLNYLLDCLPCAPLEVGDKESTQLHVRTCLARNVNLSDHTDLTIEQLRQRVQSNDPLAKQDLLSVYSLFASVYEQRTVDVATLPYGDFAVQFARSQSKRVLLSYGAIQSLERLLALIDPAHGFILINDYGPTMSTGESEFEHQRFSLATFVGVNFPLLRAFFSQPGKGEWIDPTSEAGGIHSRLLCRTRCQETVLKFWECFSAARYEYLHELTAQARAYAKGGRSDLALDLYRKALQRQPSNWVLYNEVSMFLTFSLGDVKAGIETARQALALNPTCSAELWNTLGDGLFKYGRVEEAQSAYCKALAINPSDVRSRYNLSWCHAHQKNYNAALTMIAEALDLDRTGEYRAKLEQKQDEVMAQVTRRNQREYLQMVNLVSHSAKKDGDK